jgi:hypothetical protein
VSDPTNGDGFDVRKYSSLSPLEQLNAIERDSAALEKRERDMRAAERVLDSEATKEVKP